jgi:hypothetical protein
MPWPEVPGVWDGGCLPCGPIFDPSAGWEGRSPFVPPFSTKQLPPHAGLRKGALRWAALVLPIVCQASIQLPDTPTGFFVAILPADENETSVMTLQFQPSSAKDLPPRVGSEQTDDKQSAGSAVPCDP